MAYCRTLRGFGNEKSLDLALYSIAVAVLDDDEPIRGGIALIKKVVVVAGGSAGFLCALGLRAKMPDLEVQVIRLTDAEPGLSQSSTPPLSRFLHGFLSLELRKLVELARPTWSLGHRMIWGPRPHFYFPNTSQLNHKLPYMSRNNAFYVADDADGAGPLSALMAHDKAFFRGQNGQPVWQWDSGYQLDAAQFYAAVQKLARAIGIEIIDDTLATVNQDDTGVTGLVLGSGKTLIGDLYVDASEARSLLLGQALKEPFVSYKTSLMCDRMVVGDWPRTYEALHPYVTCETMEAGWCWQLEFQQKIDRGYVYCSKFISDEQAEAEFRRKCPEVRTVRKVQFASGRYERGWVKNVVAVGAAEAYVEPLASTELGIVAARSQLLSEILIETGRQVPPAQIKLYNRHYTRLWDSVRRFLALNYKFNTRLETPFWQAARKDVDIAGGETIVEYYRQCGPSSLWAPLLVDAVDIFGAGGYLTLFVGMKVPTRAKYEIIPQERAAWESEVQKYRAAALSGIGIPEALNAAMATPAGQGSAGAAPALAGLPT
jgi:tryptophan halogenase